MRLLFAVLGLIGFGNAVNGLLHPQLPGGSRAHAALGLALSAASLHAARSSGHTWAELGLVRLWSGSLLGLASGLALVLPALAFLRLPPIFGGPVVYTPVREVPEPALARHLLVYMPLAVALPEELAFRGVLLAALRRRMPAGAAAALSAIAFMAWHGTVIGTTVRATNLTGALRSLAPAGMALTMLFGGLVFAALREKTGSLAAPFMAHWLFNAAMLAGLRRS